jgi:hypothetical protein
MNYWIFKNNPIKDFDMPRRLKEEANEKTTWNIRQKYSDQEVQPDDIAFIWRTQAPASEKKRSSDSYDHCGIIAAIRITEPAKMRQELDWEKRFWHDPNDCRANEEALRVLGKIIYRVDLLSRSKLADEPWGSLSLFRDQYDRALIVPLADDEGDALLEFVKSMSRWWKMP